MEHIERAVDKMRAARAAGFGVVAVVSAMSGETDRLLSMARDRIALPNPREIDVLVASGEQVSAALSALLLDAAGVEARSFLGHQVRILTDSVHTYARIREVERGRILAALEAGQVAVVAGFQGVDEDGDITTLGRGGSDTTAVALAAALDAEVCEIYTDVDGVYTADPALCPSATLLSRISYRHMRDFSLLGAKVLAPRSVQLAMKYRVPIHVRSSFSAAPGTWVGDSDEIADAVLGIACDNKLASIRIIGQVPLACTNSIVRELSEHTIGLEAMTRRPEDSLQLARETAIVVKRADVAAALQIVHEQLGRAEMADREVVVDTEVARISVIGGKVGAEFEVAGDVLQLFRRQGARVASIYARNTSISYILEAGPVVSRLVRGLHDFFGLNGRPDPISEPIAQYG
ncbi:MAG: aspartate kinase [Proteobacteria bacterium]|nr:aspartate kinase [Pseudomonadota bacterium]